MHKSHRIHHDKSHGQRNKAGYSLVTVLVIGAVAVMWLAATALSLMQVYQNINSGRYGAVALAAAEYGAEQEIAALNQLAASPSQGTTPTPPYDGLAVNQSKVTAWTVPTTGSNDGGTAQVTVQNIGPTGQNSFFSPPPPQSVLYSAMNDPTYTASGSAANAVAPNAQLVSYYGGVQVNDWRLVTSVGTYMSTARTVQVVLQPIYSPYNPQSPGKNVPQPQFQYGTYGLTEVSLLNNVFTDGSTLSGTTEVPNANKQGGDVGGGQAVGVGYDIENGVAGTNVEVGGSVTSLTPFVGGAPPTVAQGPSSKPTGQGYSTNGVVVDNLLTYSTGTTQQGFNIDQVGGLYVFNAANDNVQGNSFGPILGANDPITTSSVTPPSTPPAPSAPADAQYDGDLAVTGSSNAPMQPGNYVVNSLTVGASATLSTAASVSASQPVNIYIQDAPGAGNSALSIDPQGIIQNTAGNPGALNIYYNGTRPVNVTSYSNLAATVYAPNAPVVVSGNPGILATNTSATTFAGAVIGNTVRVSNVRMLFDQANLKMPSGSGTPNQTFNMTNSTGFQLLGLQAVSWNEQ